MTDNPEQDFQDFIEYEGSKEDHDYSTCLNEKGRKQLAEYEEQLKLKSK
jgi:hypothetical protein